MSSQRHAPMLRKIKRSVLATLSVAASLERFLEFEIMINIHLQMEMPIPDLRLPWVR